jgi:PD-(D/E)XK nuclease superfamily
LSTEPAAPHNNLLPHLSFSRIDRYLECPEQYRLYYLEGLRPRIPSASLLFGQTIHQALAYFFSTNGDPGEFFTKAWEALERAPVRYSGRSTWSGLGFTGQALLKKFIDEELPHLGTVEASERAFELGVSNLDVPFIGVIDLIADRNGRRTVIDFKTSSSAYQDHDVALSDQLTAYRLAVPEAEDAALCVFVKTKEPRIDWFLTKRSGSQLYEFLQKAAYVAKEITAGHFYKRPGTWCSWCDYLPICLGDTKGVEEALTRIS